MYCSKCLAKTAFPVPNYIINIEFKPTKKFGDEEVAKDYSGQEQLVCCGEGSNCLSVAVNECMELLKAETENILGLNLEEYLKHEIHITPFVAPNSEVSDTYQMKAMRYSHVAAIVADIRWQIILENKFYL